MKYVVILLFAIIVQSKSYALCILMGPTIWPQTDSINLNPIFIITDSDSRCYFSDHQLYLSASGQKVPLVLTETSQHGILICQIVLRPKELLKPGLRYVMMSDDNKFKLEEGYKKHWFTSSRIDISPPVLLEPPRVVGEEYRRMGCGPHIYTHFSLKAIDACPLMVKATVKSMDEGFVSSFYIPAQPNMVAVGRHMCGGEFDLIPGGNYEVTFSLIDASGNTSFTTSETIPFQAPSSIESRFKRS